MFKINTKFLIFTLLIIILLSGVVYAVEPVDCVGNSGSTNPLGVCKVDNTKGLAVSCYGTSCVTEKPASTGFLNIINPYSYINLDDIVNTDYYYQDYFFSPGSPSTQYDLSSNIFPIYGPGHLPFSSLADINLNLFDIEESAFDDLLVYYEDDELSNYKVLFVATMFAEEAYFKSYNLENNFSHISGENWFEIEDHNSDYNLYFGLNLVEKTCFPTTNPRAEYKLTRRNNFNYSLIFDLERNTVMGASIHMFFVFFPINLIFVDEYKKIVEIKKNLKPFQIYNPKYSCRYIIELPVEFDIKNTAVSDLLSWN